MKHSEKQAAFTAQLPALILFHTTVPANSGIKEKETNGFNDGKCYTAQQQLALYRLLQHTPGI